MGKYDQENLALKRRQQCDEDLLKVKCVVCCLIEYDTLLRIPLSIRLGGKYA